jgi:hypothetical protein
MHYRARDFTEKEKQRLDSQVIMTMQLLERQCKPSWLDNHNTGKYYIYAK